MNKGIVFDIQKFSVNDGPGIRTTVFLKGCSLNCSWCHNPESINPQIQLAYDESKCITCLKCLDSVDDESIKFHNEKLIIDFEINNKNFELTKICPTGALDTIGKEYSVRDLIDEVMKDKLYYDKSDGGVTFSGGEALNQQEFIICCSRELRKLGVKTCLDLSGFDAGNNIPLVVDEFDLFLLDFKLDISKNQNKYFGKKIDIDSVLDNFLGKNVILRCPIIPSVNDNLHHFEKISEISRYDCIQRVDILPYHDLSKNFQYKKSSIITKYRKPTKEEISNYIKILKAFSSENVYLYNEAI